MVIDIHCHLGLSVDSAEGRAGELLSLMDAHAITLAVIFPIDEKERGLTYEKQNDLILTTALRHPDRFIPFCRIQPKAGDKASEELRRCVAMGSKGIKLHPDTDKFHPSDCEEIFSLAEKLSLPVILHTSHEPGGAPLNWQESLARHGRTNFILAHGGKDRYRDAGFIANRLPHAYLDTSTLSYNRTRVLLETAGPEKILFASDYPYSHPLIEKKKIELLVSDAAQLAGIMGLNAKTILGLPDA